ncbi:MAG: hypothetical protein ACQERN_01435 [Thermodesulfobacteriota bacterium]
MPIRLDPKIKTLMQALRANGFVIKGVRNGIRLKLESGFDVDVYALRSDSDQVRARLKLDAGNAAIHKYTVDDIAERVQAGLGNCAAMDPFHFIRQGGGFDYYYARIHSVDTGEPGALRLDFTGMNTAAQKAGGDPEAAPGAFPAQQTEGADNEFEKAVERLEKVDSKMFRQALDDLGLARSSLLRVALSRIFRSAVDPEELRAAVKEEAKRVATPENRMALEYIKQSDQAGFLHPIIDMLQQEAA